MNSVQQHQRFFGEKLIFKDEWQNFNIKPAQFLLLFTEGFCFLKYCTKLIWKVKE